MIIVNKKKERNILIAIILVVIVILSVVIVNNLFPEPNPGLDSIDDLAFGRLDTGEYTLVVRNLESTGHNISNCNYSMRIVENNVTVTEFSNLSIVDHLNVNNILLYL